MSKQTGKGPDYSREREFGVMLEDLRSSFRIFGEGLTDVRNRLGRVEDKLTKLDNDVAMIKLALPHFSTMLSDHDRRIAALETAK